jgi:hypothetical protein
VDHEDRLLCNSCLARLAVPINADRSTWGWVSGLLVAGLGAGLLVVMFSSLGHLLIATPSAFHEGTLWKKSWLEDTGSAEEPSQSKKAKGMEISP